MSAPKEKKALDLIREKIQHSKPLEIRPTNLESETSKLFIRRFSVLPPNRMKALNVSSSAVNLTSTQKSTQNESLVSTQSDSITVGSQTLPENSFRTPTGSSSVHSEATTNKNSAEQATPLTAIAINQHRGKRISFTDENNESSTELMVPTAVEQPSTSSSVFKMPFSANPNTWVPKMSAPKILKSDPRKLASDSTPDTHPNAEKRPRVENHQGKNLVGYKVSLPKGLPVLGVEVNKSDGRAYVYGIARNIAFAVVVFEDQRKNIFKCHIPNCSIQIMDEVLMMKHIEACHAGQAWNLYCSKCSKILFFPNKTATMLDEFDHIKETHFKLPVEKRPDNVVSVGKNMAAFNLPQMPPVENNIHIYRNRSMSFMPRPCNDPRLNRTLHDQASNVTTEQFYNSIDAINLRPWLNDPAEYRKSKAASLAMLHEDPLAAFFKCMNKNCIYFTSDAENFRRHLALHKSFNNLCSYCSFKSSSVDNLIKHLQEEHSFDCYQCGFCFYRSLTEGNILIHKKHYHDKKPSAVVIEVMRRGYKEKVDRLTIEARAYENIAKFVSKLVCACGRDFYLFNDFEMHIKEHGTHKMNYNCSKCNHSIPLQDLTEHHEKCLKQSYIQCIFCLFGCQNSSKINEHLTNHHPSNVLMYCDRTESMNHDASTYKCLNLKVPEKIIENAIIIRRLDASSALRNNANIDKLIYVSSEEPTVNDAFNESLLEQVFSTNSFSSVFSNPSEIEEMTLGVINTMDSDDYRTMFDPKKSNEMN